MTKNTLLISVAASAMALLSGCGGGPDAPVAVVAPPPPPPTPAPPPPPPTQTGFSNARCLDQLVAGRKLVDIAVPDQLNLDLSAPSNFPNGRDLDDPVVDLTLAGLFLDLTRHPADLLARLPLNPNQFDQRLRDDFPYFAPANGTPPLSATNGTNFTFRSDPLSNYVQVDRMGGPAISTALVLTPRKNAYNDGSPAADAAGTFVPDILAGFQGLTNALRDDLTGLGLTPCSTVQ